MNLTNDRAAFEFLFDYDYVIFHLISLWIWQKEFVKMINRECANVLKNWCVFLKQVAFQDDLEILGQKPCNLGRIQLVRRKVNIHYYLCP